MQSTSSVVQLVDIHLRWFFFFFFAVWHTDEATQALFVLKAWMTEGFHSSGREGGGGAYRQGAVESRLEARGERVGGDYACPRLSARLRDFWTMNQNGAQGYSFYCTDSLFDDHFF